MGLIAVEGMQFYAHHGFTAEERVIGGQFQVDVYLRTNFSDAAREDDIQKTIDYEQVYRLVKKEIEVPAKLIERVVKVIMDELHQRFPEAFWCKVRVSKMTPPLKGTVQRVYVEVEKDFSRSTGKTKKE